MSREEFIDKYQFDMAGRILVGVRNFAEPAELGVYSRDVHMGCRAWLDKIYTELVPQNPPPPTKGSK